MNFAHNGILYWLSLDYIIVWLSKTQSNSSLFKCRLQIYYKKSRKLPKSHETTFYNLLKNYGTKIQNSVYVPSLRFSLNKKKVF